jgi:hypothetical protein
MIIRLDEYRRARTQKLATHRRDEELLCVNWNPIFGIVALSCYKTPQELSPQMPDDFEGVDMTVFVERLRGLATQI